MLLVQRKIAFGGVQRVGADIEVGHRLGAATRGVNGEAAGEAEGIQHAPSLCEQFHFAPVFPLVEEKSCLLTAQDIGFEADAIFREDHRAIRGGAGHHLTIV